MHSRALEVAVEVIVGVEVEGVEVADDGLELLEDVTAAEEGVDEHPARTATTASAPATNLALLNWHRRLFHALQRRVTWGDWSGVLGLTLSHRVGVVMGRWGLPHLPITNWRFFCVAAQGVGADGGRGRRPGTAPAHRVRR